MATQGVTRVKQPLTLNAHATAHLGLTMAYRTYALKYRAQTLATAMLGTTPGMSTRAIQARTAWIAQRARGREFTR
jgi:hypothetical protein